MRRTLGPLLALAVAASLGACVGDDLPLLEDELRRPLAPAQRAPASNDVGEADPRQDASEDADDDASEPDPYFTDAGRIGAPPSVGAQPAPEAQAAPFELRGEPAPTTPAPSVRQTPPSDAVEAPTADLPDAYVPDAAGILAEINAFRARYGADPLSYDPKLSLVAAEHVRDLAERGDVSSDTASGQGVLARIEARGLEPDMAASLVAGGYRDVPSALNAWRGDRSQSARLLMPSANTLGLAIHEDRRSTYRYYIEAIVAAVPQD